MKLPSHLRLKVEVNGTKSEIDDIQYRAPGPWLRSQKISSTRTRFHLHVVAIPLMIPPRLGSRFASTTRTHMDDNRACLSPSLKFLVNTILS